MNVDRFQAKFAPLPKHTKGYHQTVVLPCSPECPGHEGDGIRGYYSFFISGLWYYVGTRYCCWPRGIESLRNAVDAFSRFLGIRIETRGRVRWRLSMLVGQLAAERIADQLPAVSTHYGWDGPDQRARPPHERDLVCLRDVRFHDVITRVRRCILCKRRVTRRRACSCWLCDWKDAWNQSRRPRICHDRCHRNALWRAWLRSFRDRTAAARAVVACMRRLTAPGVNLDDTITLKEAARSIPFGPDGAVMDRLVERGHLRAWTVGADKKPTRDTRSAALTTRREILRFIHKRLSSLARTAVERPEPCAQTSNDP